MSINAIDFVAQPHLHSNKATAEIVATVVVVAVCVYACECVCCLYSLCHMQIAATAASRCPVKGFKIYADFRRLRIVQRVFGVFYLASLAFFVD